MINTNAFIYGISATLIVSLLSLCGLFLVPLFNGPHKHRWLQLFISLAVSTLSSDVFFHLIPTLMGTHDHHHEEDQNSTAHNLDWNDITEERAVILKMSIVLWTIYILYFLESFASYRISHRKKERLHNNGLECGIKTSQHAWEEVPLAQDEQQSSSSSEIEENIGCCGLKSSAVIILLGDGIHNIVDGMAIGISFLSSISLGITTTIAVICHELPHEIGDLAVLLDSGLSLSRALLFNFLSALTAFIGLFASLFLGEIHIVGQILLSLTTAMFLYVAWIDMLPHLKHDVDNDDYWMISVPIQLTGFILGFIGMFSLAWFEHSISISS